MIDDALIKVCTKCKDAKPAACFRKDRAKTDGLYSSCNDCNAERLRLYRLANPELVKVSQRAAVEKSKDHYKAYKAEWHSAHRERQNTKSLQRYSTNRQAILEARRAKTMTDQAAITEKACINCGAIRPMEMFSRGKKGCWGVSCNNCKGDAIERKRIKTLARNKVRYAQNRTAILQKDYQAKKARLATDPNYKIKEVLAHRIRRAIYDGRNVKAAQTIELLGCSIDHVRAHLEALFQPGMTWENRGIHGWHIDHIIPVSYFDLSDPAQQRRCFHYTNLQPLWAKDNLSKAGNLPKGYAIPQAQGRAATTRTT
jgi:hypothetical protein